MSCPHPSCSGHGTCVDGGCICICVVCVCVCICMCVYIYMYIYLTCWFMVLVSCPHPSCSGHGTCVDGGCICQPGWRGEICDKMDADIQHCLPKCSNHGKFNMGTMKCECETGWTGSDCSTGKSINLQITSGIFWKS